MIRAEAAGGSAVAPGLRAMDLYGNRYITREKRLSMLEITRLARDMPSGVIIHRNEAARPRFQIYRDATYVGSPAAALGALRLLSHDLLILERSYSGTRPKIDEDRGCADPLRADKLRVMHASSMHYLVIVDVACPAWLFLSDANDPGWEASVNGSRKPVFTGQYFGKAVRLERGHNRVSFDYAPRAFYRGASISSFSPASVAIGLGIGHVRRHRRRALPTLHAPAG